MLYYFQVALFLSPKQLNHVTALICVTNWLAPKMVSPSTAAISSIQVLGLQEQ